MKPNIAYEKNIYIHVRKRRMDPNRESLEDCFLEYLIEISNKLLFENAIPYDVVHTMLILCHIIFTISDYHEETDFRKAYFGYKEVRM